MQFFKRGYLDVLGLSLALAVVGLANANAAIPTRPRGLDHPGLSCRKVLGLASGVSLVAHATEYTTVEIMPRLRATQSPESLLRLVHAITTQTIFSFSDATPMGERAIVSIPDPEHGRPTIVEISFRSNIRGYMSIHSLSQPSKSEINDYYVDIAEHFYPAEDMTLHVRSGVFHGLDVLVHPRTIAKLLVKHQIDDLGLVLRILEHMQQSPVPTIFAVRPGDTFDADRYYFVQSLDGKNYFKVVLDVRESHGKMHLILVSAYPVRKSDYARFREEQIDYISTTSDASSNRRRGAGRAPLN